LFSSHKCRGLFREPFKEAQVLLVEVDVGAVNCFEATTTCVLPE
jgi:hypothetical protein